MADADRVMILRDAVAHENRVLLIEQHISEIKVKHHEAQIESRRLGRLAPA